MFYKHRTDQNRKRLTGPQIRASAGASEILLVTRDPSSADIQETRETIIALPHHPTCEILRCDLNNRWAVTHFIEFNFTWGNRRLDILVNCGGVQHRSPAEDFPIAEWDNILNVNLTSAFIITQALAKYWLETSLNPNHAAYAINNGRRKKIIFIGSVTTIGTGSVDISAYVASKGAIGQLTKGLNNEWMSRGINVNAVAPGYILTELTRGVSENEEKERHIMERVPAKRWGLPEDLAGATIYLCSRASDFVGGEV